MKILVHQKYNNDLIFLHNREIGIRFNNGNVNLFYPWEDLERNYKEVELYQIVFDLTQNNVTEKILKEINKIIIKSNKKNYDNFKIRETSWANYKIRDIKLSKSEFISLMLKKKIEKLNKYIKGEEE